MSYLGPLRLHFAGKFQANVSTVNNDPTHFDNSQFLPAYQTLQTINALNGWFNPTGDAAWRLVQCQVTDAILPDSTVAATDPIRSYLIADSDSGVCAKLVDLDPEQQLVSEIWGLQVRIIDGQGHTLLRGDFEPAAFMDIWDRSTGGGAGGDVTAGAMYQSVLTRLQWGDVSQSAFLQALKSAATDGLLSIKFNLDGINFDNTSPDFMCGRIVGTIGPAQASEPHHFVAGRQLMAAHLPAAALQGSFFLPAGSINFCVARVDGARGKVYLDLGNALPTGSPGGRLSDLGDLTLLCPGATPQDPPVIIGTLSDNDYAADKTWYGRTAGIVEFPAGRPLTATELAAVLTRPLSLNLAAIAGGYVPSVVEASDGTFVRADRIVYRMNAAVGEPDNAIQVPLCATRFGQAYPGQQLVVKFYSEMLQAWPAPHLKVGVPENALQFSATTVPTDARGVAVLTVTASDPKNPRSYIDGQVYGLQPGFAVSAPGLPYQWNFVSILLWNRFVPDQPITWHGSIQPIFQQYANLYPVMKRFMDLGDYEAVCANARLLTLAFDLDPANPNSMPVTRDLSYAKRRAILAWLKNPLKGDPKPLPGATHKQANTLLAHGRGATSEPAAPLAPPPELFKKGGKAAAAARRVGPPCPTAR